MNFRRVRTSLALEEAAGISPREDLRRPWRALRLRLGCRHREGTSVACRGTAHGVEVDLLPGPKVAVMSPPHLASQVPKMTAQFCLLAKRPPVHRNQSLERFSSQPQLVLPPAHLP